MRRKPRHKFHAQPTERDGQRFDSKLEARVYDRLKLQQGAGEVVFFLRQTRFDLPGGVTYRCDFQVFYADGTVAFLDAKGFRTPQYVRSKKQVESLYPVTIEEVTR